MILELIILFLISSLLARAILTYATTRRLPPSPLALPVIGHLHLLGPLLHHTFRDLSFRHGPLFSLRLGSIPCVVATTAELAKELLKNNELTFTSRKHSMAIDHLTYHSSFAFSPYGPYWKFIKKLCMWELLGSRTLSNFFPIRAEEYRHFLRVLAQKSEAGKAVNVTEELIKLANNIISRMMLGTRCSGTEGEAEEARFVIREVTQIFGEFNVSDFIWFCKNLDLQGFGKRIKDIHRRYDALLEKIISDREEVRKMKKKSSDDNGGDDKVKDLLDILLDFKEDESSEVKLSRDHIKALVLDFFTAATDTTAIATEWLLAELINNPKIMEKAREEIQRVVGNNRLVSESDGPNLPYIQAIIKETFRLHPPIPIISRKSIEDCQIGKYTIPAGTLLFVNGWAIGRDPKYWESPLEFRPERFLQSGDGGAIDVRGQHFQLLPFGSGRRGCPGISLALLELPVMIGTLIQFFDWTAISPDGAGGGEVDMSERPGLTAPRAKDLMCVLKARLGLDILGM